MEIFEVRKNMQNHSMELSTGLDSRSLFHGFSCDGPDI
jgi:hypothetical protein